ncbi:tRNA dihydrouridine synthase DusB [Leptolyngbya sp. 7M]|uniref:tRNA dihydrouridine synthase DusB n=1 Tax=Leptolyngbya sp. 7M TaxID=2812896 RepID=UPI001B8CB3D8|nr:tRNA dihydrouridine synthase DusB [Leptolyngbya sp. 7M]QYO66267.1 tRNA dihydrouridine synthase DusB [Leptolyngbya sp. 7M]
MKSFYVRDVLIDPPLILSPMAGVTDYVFRRLIKRRGGVGLVVSEFISVEGLTRGNPKSKRQMRFDQEERPFAVQIFGGRPERMAMGAEMAEEVGADILDVNCGCPAPKVVKNGGGSGLLREPGRLEEILKEIKRSISIPLTLKLRTGYSESTINVVDVAKMAEQCGVEHIQVHGRTREQGYKGLANWDLIRQVKEAVSIPVSGNGDITSIEYGLRKWQQAGTDGILIGRGAMQNPWIFRQFADVLAGREPFQPDLVEKKAVLLEFFEMCLEEMPEIVALGKMKQLAGQFTKGLVGGAQFRQTLYHSHSADEILDNITEYFSTLSSGKAYGDGQVESDDVSITSCSQFTDTRSGSVTASA